MLLSHLLSHFHLLKNYLAIQKYLAIKFPTRYQTLQVTKIILTFEKYQKSAKTLKDFERNDRVLGNIMENWDMGLVLN